MIELVPVISVRELPPARSRSRQHLMSLRDLVRPCPSSGEAAISSYLAQGVVCGIYHDPGLLFDVLSPGRRLDPTLSDESAALLLGIQPGMVLTDGTWVWFGVLTYYVREYHLHLPEQFSRFARERAWKFDPSSIGLDDLDWSNLDAGHEMREAVK